MEEGGGGRVEAAPSSQRENKGIMFSQGEGEKEGESRRGIRLVYSDFGTQ